jgi:O-6-methylguanine DNA methyltransferase
VSASKGRSANLARADRSFTERVLSTVRRIPPGRVATYGDVAELAGRPRAARAVGNIMRDCRRRDVPCHRVIAAGGRLGGYGGSEFLKRSLLAAEGIVVSGSRIRDLDRILWRPRLSRNARKHGTRETQ